MQVTCRYSQPAQGRSLRAILMAASVVTALSAVTLFFFLLYFSLPLFRDGALAALLSWHWRPLQGEFGILSLVVGSLCLAISALLIAYPLALGVCAFACGIGPGWAVRLLRSGVRFMSGIPTVVYGLVALFLLVPLLRGAFSGSGFSWLAALLTLAVLLLPTLVLILDSQFRLVLPGVRLTTAALGFSPAQTFWWLVLPRSRRGLVMAAVLGFGRATGDALIPLMLSGNAPQVPHALTDPLRTLTAHIALVVATDSQSAAYASLFACGLLLFTSSLGVNLALAALRGKETEHSA